MATVVQTITVTCATTAERALAVTAVNAWRVSNADTTSVVTTANNPPRVVVAFPAAAWVVPTVV